MNGIVMYDENNRTRMLILIGLQLVTALVMSPTVNEY
jgi:hypothetical protein